MAVEPGARCGRGGGGGAYENQSQAQRTSRWHAGKRLGRKEKWGGSQVRVVAEAGEERRPRACRKHNSRSHGAFGWPMCSWPENTARALSRPCLAASNLSQLRQARPSHAPFRAHGVTAQLWLCARGERIGIRESQI